MKYIFNHKTLTNFYITSLFLLPQYYIFTFLSVFVIAAIHLGIFVSRRNIISFIFSAIILFTIIVNISNFVNTREIIRILIILLLFNSIIKIQFENISVKLLGFILLYLVVFQFFSSFDILGFKNLMYTLYPQDEEMILNFDYGILDSTTDFSFFRSGGIYYNPNLQGQYIVGLLLIFLITVKKKCNIYLVLLFYIVSFLSVILSGSRTSFVIISAIIFLNISRKYIVYLAIFMFLVLSYIIFNLELGGLRIFDIVNDLKNSDGSSNVKLNLLLDYIKSSLDSISGIFKLLIGNLWDGKLHLDSDIGYIIYSFGLINLVILFIYLFSFWRVIKFKYIYLYLFYSFTATIFFNFKLIFIWFTILALAINQGSLSKNQNA